MPKIAKTAKISKSERASLALVKGSLSRHLVYRLIPALLALVALDISVTWLIMHGVHRGWLMEDVFMFLLAGQVVLVLLFAWLLIFGVRSGLGSVNALAKQIEQRSIDDLQAIDVKNVPTELMPLITRINDLLARLDDAVVAQRRFIGHAAHQLRTPLAGLRLESELMLAKPLPEDIQMRAERIKSVTNRMIRLGQQLLVLARVDPSARPQDSFKRINLVEWAQLFGAEWVPRLRAQHINLQLEEPGQAVWIEGDKLLLEELLSNLMDNALRYAKDAKNIILSVSANPPSLSLEDDGCGIDPEDIEHVFEAFYRSEKVTSSGSGLGLPIVREIALAHGAWWSLSSKPEINGTRIAIVFPGPRRGAQLNRKTIQ